VWSKLESAVESAGTPLAMVGVVIALLPETVAAVRAALRNRLGTSVNLVLGRASLRSRPSRSRASG
jgi:Ca2+:H+ antiporter